MKIQTYLRTLLVLLFFNFIAVHNFAQTLAKPEQICTDNISTFLKNNNYDVVEITKDYLKIKKKDGSRYIFLDLKDNGRYIFFNVAYKVVEQTPQGKIDAYLKTVNANNVIKVRYFEKGNDVQIEYYFWTKQGFTYESLLDAVNEYLLYVGDCVNADKEKILQ